jgi:hypothetical protein
MMKRILLILLFLWGQSLCAQSALQDLAGLDGLTKWFQENTGKVRVIILLSPT